MNFREFLNKLVKSGEIKKLTADNYYSAIKTYKESEMSLEEYLNTLKNKNRVSIIKNSLRLYSDYKKVDFGVNIFDEYAEKKPRTRRRPEPELKLSKTLKKVNGMRNDKKNYRKKVAYRLMLVSGLRVFEVAKLKKSDITIDGDSLYVHVRQGKRDKERCIKTIKDKYLVKHLPEILQNTKDNKKVFHSSSTLKQKAGGLNIKTKDFRKAFALIIERKTDKTGEEKIELIKEGLGHAEKGSTYKKYTSRKINFDDTPWE